MKNQLRNRINKLENFLIPSCEMDLIEYKGKPEEDFYRLRLKNYQEESYKLICDYFGLIGESSRGVL